MLNKQEPATVDPEVAAMSTVVIAIQGLDSAAQQRVIGYVIQRFNLQLGTIEAKRESSSDRTTGESERYSERDQVSSTQKSDEEDGLEGINAVARKWMSRSGLSSEALSKLFSLGIDEIDLVATKVPGKNKKNRMRSIVLLKGVASYLGGGVARITHEQMKETCLHYDAYDASNFATYLREMSAEVGGTKETGYTLTARGLTAATELIKQILHPPPK